MKRLKTITVVLAMALLCFSATAMAAEFSFYDSVNEWIVSAYSKLNPAGGYSVYLKILDNAGENVDSELILLTKNQIRLEPDPSQNDDYLVCSSAVGSDISLAYTSLGGVNELYVLDHHLNELQVDYLKVHNQLQLSGFDMPDPANIAVSGSGSFGTVNVGSSSTSYITVSNTGEVALTLNSIIVSGASFEREGGTCGSTVAGGGNCTIGVKFEPEAATSYTGSLAIQSSDGDTPTFNVALSGTGFQQTGTPDLVVTNSTHTSAISNNTYLHITLSVKNQGSGTAGPSKVKTTKGSSTPLLDFNVPSIAAGQTVQVTGSVLFTCPVHATYYLYHNADGDLQVTESNETNNRRVSVITCNR